MAVTCFRPIWPGLEAFLLVHVDSPVIVSELLVGVSRCSWSELASCYVSVSLLQYLILVYTDILLHLQANIMTRLKLTGSDVFQNYIFSNTSIDGVVARRCQPLGAY